MAKAEQTTSQSVELVRAIISGKLRDPINGKLMERFLDVTYEGCITYVGKNDTPPVSLHSFVEVQ